MLFFLAMHARLLFTLLLSIIVLLVWAIVLWARNRQVGRYYRAGTAIVELLLLAECLIGVVLLLAGRVPNRMPMHIVYGLIALATLPASFALAHGRNNRTGTLVIIGGLVFLAAIVLRALATGR